MKKTILQWGWWVLLLSLLCSPFTFASEITGTIDTGVSTGINGTVITPPTFSPVAGTYTAAQSVSLSAAGSTGICYRTDGTSPTCLTSTTCAVGSTLYGSTISIASTTTIKALSCYPGNGGVVASSSVSSATYTISISSWGGGGGGGGWGGGGGGGSSPICLDSQLECMPYLGSYVWLAKPGVSCDAWIKGKVCQAPSTGGGTSTSSGSSITITLESGTDLTILKTENSTTITITSPTGSSTVTFNKPPVILSLWEIKATDIATNWAKTYIQKLIARWIVNNAEKYNPDNNLTRAEFLKIAFNAAGWKTGTSGVTPFADVRSNTWYAPYVALALSKNIISKTNTNFRPNDTISRAETAKIIVGIFGVKTGTPKGIFADMSLSSDLTKYAEIAKALNIFSGQIIDGKLKFRPNDSITRAEIAKVVVNAFGL